MTDEKAFISKLKDPRTREEAFRILVAEYKQRLYWHIRKIVLNHDDADDVLQNTFIKIFRGINEFKGESKLYSWMYRIASNESFTWLHEKAKREKVKLTQLQRERIVALQSDVYYDGDEIQLKLQQAIATLPEKQQLVFNMKYFDAMKYEEISEILETSIGALKASYHHAVKKIEAFLMEK